ncbi:MAG TPA: TetR/AcrR family transcriptional regulator [Candidatus Polarisedimenticolia bacterium]|jgi:AcrR family transcriptional regulator|nr:TetR/AcrR family transcriptional regulator [Candidatus Polarisedimenticolia bacterium]
MIQIQAVRTPARPPGPRAARRKLEILRGAAAAFRDRGYAATSVRDIARRTGMTPGNLYYYFRNKQEILYFCQDASLDVLLGEARRIRHADLPADAKVRALVRAQVLLMLDALHGAAGHIEFHAIPKRRLRTIIAKRDAYEALVRRVVREGVRSGRFVSCDAKLASLAILGAVNWTARWYRPGGGWAPGRIADAFADQLVRGLLK